MSHTSLLGFGVYIDFSIYSCSFYQRLNEIMAPYNDVFTLHQVPQALTQDDDYEANASHHSCRVMILQTDTEMMAFENSVIRTKPIMPQLELGMLVRLCDEISTVIDEEDSVDAISDAGWHLIQYHDF